MKNMHGTNFILMKEGVEMGETQRYRGREYWVKCGCIFHAGRCSP